MIVKKEGNMSGNVQKFAELAGFYNMLLEVMSAVCVQKGGIAIENYVGRFFAADVLEFIAEYGKRLKKNGVDPEISGLIAKFEDEFEKAKGLVTPTEKPFHEMTLEEFEKAMNI
jgi:hypothetical protein